ncbi:hypothetical protein DY000_02037362 [Brassica cretica]|uniref:Uncharacterized protein n=1 Tax=Brassica cretica TaxID=69181 RepID=A0ABQ7BLD7_BRACR|nr:hypothetical protein DY000_02037362 [Brassica cretica]
MNTGQDEEPLPSTGTIGGDRTPPTVKTNHGRTNLRKGSNRRAKTDKDKLEDAKTKSIGKRIVGDVGEVGAMKVVASRRQSGTVIGGLSMALGETHGRTDGAGESMSDLTAEQLFKINELHIKTVQEENMLTKQSATLQEDTADMPIAVAAFHKERIVC